MQPTSIMCRAQARSQLARADGTTLENVRQLAMNAAAAWTKEAVLADRREALKAETGIRRAADSGSVGIPAPAAVL